MSFKAKIDGLLNEALDEVKRIEGIGQDEIGRLRDALHHSKATLSTIPEPPAVDEPVAVEAAVEPPVVAEAAPEAPAEPEVPAE